jgi:predicted NUDIX family NTP pyrophosphohydrolase
VRNKVSAGLLMYRFREGQVEVLLVYPGGPFAMKKDEGHWSIPKGETEPGEQLLETGIREFREEVGLEAKGEFFELGSIRQRSGKIVHAWAVQGDGPPTLPLSSMTFPMEWPPGSHIIQHFQEIDRAEFFTIQQARFKLKAAQVAFLDRLLAIFSNRGIQADDPGSHPA